MTFTDSVVEAIFLVGGEFGCAQFRTSYFPGLGWMMRRQLWEELSPKFPRQAWDHWFRLPTTAQGQPPGWETHSQHIAPVCVGYTSTAAHPAHSVRLRWWQHVAGCTAPSHEAAASPAGARGVCRACSCAAAHAARVLGAVSGHVHGSHACRAKAAGHVGIVCRCCTVSGCMSPDMSVA